MFTTIFKHLGIERRRAVFQQSFGGYLNRIISSLQGLILIPLYVFYLGEHIYGYWLATGGIIGWLGVVDIGIGGLIVQKISSSFGKNELDNAGQWFATGILIYLLLCMIFIAIGFIVSSPIIGWLVTKGEVSKLITECFRLMIVAVAIGLLNDILRGFAQALLRPLIPALALAVARLLGITITIVALYQGIGLFSIAYGALATAILGLVFNIIYDGILIGHCRVRPSINMEYMKIFVAVAPATFLSRIGRASVRNIEPLLITSFARPELATVYYVTKSAANMMVNMIQTFSFSFFPSFSGLVPMLSNGSLIETIYGFYKVIFYGSLLGVAMYITFNKTFVSLWVGADAYAGSSVTFLVGAGCLMLLMQEASVRILNGFGDFVGSSILIFFECVLRVLLMILGAWSFGMEGVALSVLCSTSIFYYIFQCRIIKQRQFQIQYNMIYKWIISGVSVLSVSYIIKMLLPNKLGWFGFAGYGVMSLLIMVGMVYFVDRKNLILFRNESR